MNYLVTYDIENNKNRKKLSDLLEAYGQRVNYSVFECILNQTKLKKLQKKIMEEELFNKKSDSIRFYHICKNCVPKSFELSSKSDIFEQQELFI
jgi:CRISPR-associated protein Cas2